MLDNRPSIGQNCNSFSFKNNTTPVFIVLHLSETGIENLVPAGSDIVKIISHYYLGRPNYIIIIPYDETCET